MQNWQGPTEIGVACYSYSIGKGQTHPCVYFSSSCFFQQTDIKPPLMILSLKAAQCSPVPAPVEYKKERFYATTLIEIATKTGEATLDIFTLGNLFLIAIDNNPHTAHQPSTMSGDSVHPANDMWCTAVQAVPPPPWSLQNILGSGFWSSSWYMQKSSSREYFANMGGAPQSAAVKSAQISEVGLLIIVFLSRLMLKTPLCTVQCRCTILRNITQCWTISYSSGAKLCILHCTTLFVMHCIAMHGNTIQNIANFAKNCFGFLLQSILYCCALNRETGTLLKNKATNHWYLTTLLSNRKRMKSIDIYWFSNRRRWRRQILPFLHIVLGSKHFHCLLSIVYKVYTF